VVGGGDCACDRNPVCTLHTEAPAQALTRHHPVAEKKRVPKSGFNEGFDWKPEPELD